MSNKSIGDNCSLHDHSIKKHQQAFSNSTLPSMGQNTIECLLDFHLKPNTFNAPASNTVVWALSKSVSSNTKVMSKIEAGRILLEQSHWTTCSPELLKIDACPLCFDPPFLTAIDVAGHYGKDPEMYENLSLQQKVSSLMKPLYPVWYAIK